jgi:hypothetical protein
MRTPNDIDIEKWDDLIEEMYKNSWQESIQRYRSNYAFRGLSDKNYKLITSLIRLGGEYDKLERNIIRNFEKYARIENSMYSDWEMLTIAQHHGLPTRILDWTYSPFVALHFATANIAKYNTDGVIWCVDFVELHKLLPQAYKQLLEVEGANVFTVYMLNKVASDLQRFDKSSENKFVLFFEPPSMDDRIINQFALHSIISDPTAILDDILTENSEYKNVYKRIIIPSELKWEIRDKLDQANINERVMFPGLDGLSKWLSRHYSPK